MRHGRPMTGEVINLRRARKERVRAKKRDKADANAARHGRSRAEKALGEAREALEARKLDGLKRDNGAVDSPDGGDGDG